MAATFLNQMPQPGDGAFLLRQGPEKKRRRRKKVQSYLHQEPGFLQDEVRINGKSPLKQRQETFLLRSVRDVQDEVNFEKQGSGKSHPETFLRTYSVGKEPSTAKMAPDPLVPRTIANEVLLSQNGQVQHSSPDSRADSFLNQPVDGSIAFKQTENTVKDDDMATATRAKSIPPHLRRKKDESKATAEVLSAIKDEDIGAGPGKQPVHRAADKPNSQQPALQVNGTDIRKRLAEDHGVHVSDTKSTNKTHATRSNTNATVKGLSVGLTKPALVNYPSSNEDHKGAPNGLNTSRPAASSTAESKRGKPAFRGTRGGRGGRQPRQSRWTTHAETKPDPKRWEITWDDTDERSFSSADSVCANAGFGDGKKKKKQVEEGIDPDTGFRLTDWSGNWAPAPVDWDSRPAFRDGQSVQKIEHWLDGIEEEMRRTVGSSSWAVSTNPITVDGTTYYFSPDPEKADLRILGDPAPRYWIPMVFGNNSSSHNVCQAPQTFWNELLKSQHPKPYDDEDLVGAKPWWQLYQVPGGHYLKPHEPPVIEGIDPDENEGERIAREHDNGSNYHTENRKKVEKAKKEAQRERRKKAQEKARKISVSVDSQNLEKIKPGIKLYVRSARPEDIPRIREIYNYYVDFAVCTPETVRRTQAHMQQRLDDVRGNRLPFLVAVERGGKVPARRKKDKGEEIILPDKVVGFAMGDDYNDMQGIYRFTAEVEVFVDKDYYMKGVAKCLLDKLIAMLDPMYMGRGGYEVVGEDLDGTGPQRIISNIIINLPYDKDRPERLAWMEKWLCDWLQFEKVGDLKSIGLKEGKSVNMAIFQRKTGEEINPQLPPVTMSYPT